MPIRRAVWTIRQAISPRLAIRIFQNAATIRLGPVRLALVEEGGHALLAFVAGADSSDAPRRVVQHLGRDGLAGDVVDQTLRGDLGPGSAEQDGVGNLLEGSRHGVGR